MFRKILLFVNKVILDILNFEFLFQISDFKIIKFCFLISKQPLKNIRSNALSN